MTKRDSDGTPKSSGATRVIGIQSGNAIDGIDVCVVDFDEPLVAANGRDVLGLSYNCLAFKSYAWPGNTRDRILAARDGSLSTVQLAELNYELGRVFGDAALRLVEESGIDKSTIRLVSSHGQSIVGHPHWEFGDISVIAQRTGLTTAGDFRPADVAAGGNGSPCTCSFDSIMLRPKASAEKWRTAINIGGTTSMTFCPQQGSTEAPVGLDPGIGVFYMDLNAKAVLGEPYDDDGNLSRAGKVSDELLAEMLQHPHYQRNVLPISIGAEDFPRPLFHEWKAKAQKMGLKDADFQATLVELTTRGLASAASRFGPPGKLGHDVIVRGGVRFNSYFMQRLKANLAELLKDPEVKLVTLDELGMDEDSWETVMYAMFGFLCHRGLNNFVPSCTGAARAVCGGKVCTGGMEEAEPKPMMRCLASGAAVDPLATACFACPQWAARPEACNLLVPDTSGWAPPRIFQMPSRKGLENNPFVRFRQWLFTYRLARSCGLSDADWLSIVGELDQGLAKVEPSGAGGFRRTPLKYYEDLKVWAKDETGQVGQSHKARHFAVAMLYLQVLLRSGLPAAKGLRDRRLVVASCGNAALGAATVAAAVSWPIQVFIPDDAAASVVARLKELNADITVCPKADNAKLGGNATVHRFREAVEKQNAIPFSVQASDNCFTAEGSSTLLWEALEQMYELKGISELGSVLVQCGGGALASGIYSGMETAVAVGALPRIPPFHVVQCDGCAPLNKCLGKLRVKASRAEEAQSVIAEAVKTERAFMEVWPNPHGIAHCIQDDEVYDWPRVCEGILRTSGSAQVVTDQEILESWKTIQAKGVNVCHTGAAGYAGVLHMRSAKPSSLKEPTLVVFSGLHRG